MDYMRGFPQLFGEAWNGFPDFEAYLAYMGQDGPGVTIYAWWLQHTCYGDPLLSSQIRLMREVP